MKQIGKYKILELIQEGDVKSIFRAFEKTKAETVILKVLKTAYVSAEEIIRFKQEYQLIQNVSIDGVIKVLEIIEEDSYIAIVESDDNSQSLKYFMNNNRIDLDHAICIAIDLAKILGQLHKKNIIHRDINPKNILYNEQSKKVQLTDFGISMDTPEMKGHISEQETIEGTLLYMSPEQTGRMNRSVDYRTDMYSLGITLYEIFTGTIPFRSDDPLELIYFHIAKEVEPPIERNTTVPKILSDIILKLLEKNVEDRYQNCYGLLADLKTCQNQFAKENKINEFMIGQKDFPIKYRAPELLIGRQEEMTSMLDAFERVCKGNSEIMMVSGYSGIGKSALINEIHKPIVAKKGYFISGKFELLKRNIPYSAIILAFQSIISQLLSENDKKILAWKELILNALGVNASIIIDVIPNLEMIIGEQPEAIKLNPEESQNRFILVFTSFVQVFAKREHPIVIFLDDLQWADSASIRLISNIVSNKEVNNLFLMGAYRHNEVNEQHILHQAIVSLEKSGIFINKISLDPLKQKDVNELLCAFMKTNKSEVEKLAEITYEKTKGNPFFINQFLKSLYDDDMLRIDPVKGWLWNLNQIQKMEVTDNVIDILVSNIERLPDKVKEIIKVASCIGNVFGIDMLSNITGFSIEDLMMHLSIMIEEGLILYEKNNYRFQHDRVLEAAHFLLEVEIKKSIHYLIGNIIIEKNDDEHIQKQIFYVVDQLNYGLDLSSSEEMSLKIANLNLKAAIKAKDSAAYDSANTYISVCKRILDQVSEQKGSKYLWENHYQFVLAAMEEFTEIKYLTSAFKEVEHVSEIVFENTKKAIDRARTYRIRILSLFAQNRSIEAINEGRVFLKLIGVTLPKKPTDINIVIQLILTKIALIRTSIKRLSTYPEMSKKEDLSAIQTLAGLGVTAYISHPKLFPIVALKSIRHTLKYGIAPESPFIIGAYGTINCAVLGNIKQGVAFGKLALELSEREFTRSLRGRTMFTVYALVWHWQNHLQESLEPLKAAYYLGLEKGDIEYAGISINGYCGYSYYVGKPLKELSKEMAGFTHMARQFKQESLLNWLEVFRQVCLNLTNNTEDPCTLIGEAYDEEKLLPVQIETNNITAIVYFYMNKLILAYLFEDYKNAYEYSIHVENDIDSILGFYYVPVFYFYQTLTMLSLYKLEPRKVQRKLKWKIYRNRRKLKKWAKHAPMNYKHKLLLIDAEIDKVLHSKTDGIWLYDDAISACKQNKYLQEEAIANECAAKYWFEVEKESVATAYLQRAYRCYALWGAETKLTQLRKKYDVLFDSFVPGELASSSTIHRTTTKTVSSSDSIDLSTVMKAHQAISGEIKLQKLIKSMMKILIENAGAQRGFMIVEQDHKYYIEAEVNEKNNVINVMKKIPLNECKKISISVINYMFRTKEPVVLNDAVKEGKFVNDPYILQYKPKSVLCMPIMHKNIITGALYLENNIATDAFTENRITLLQMLATQAAISIENAMVYEHLEEKVQERTKDLKAANEQIKQQESQLIQQEKLTILGDITASVAHEINTPLLALSMGINNMKRYTDMLREEVNQSSKLYENSFFKRMHKKYDSANNLLLMSVEKIRKQIVNMKAFIKFQDNVDEFDINEEIDTVLSILNFSLLSYMDVQKECSKDIPALKGNPVQFNQVLMNIIKNASEARLKDKGVISIRTYLDGNKVWIEITDDGAGIDEKDVNKIFEAHFTTKEGAAGMGLSTAKVNMESYGGSIDVKSSPGKGTTFTIIFNCERNDSA